jgi:hypothetical protein
LIFFRELIPKTRPETKKMSAGLLTGKTEPARSTTRVSFRFASVWAILRDTLHGWSEHNDLRLGAAGHYRFASS